LLVAQPISGATRSSAKKIGLRDFDVDIVISCDAVIQTRKDHSRGVRPNRSYLGIGTDRHLVTIDSGYEVWPYADEPGVAGG
jgi:hypothetical protein